MVDRSPVRACLADRYELGDRIGSGGMGDVVRAVDLRLGREVAVKMLRADLAGRPDARRRFEREARAAARLAHPNVVTVYDSDESDGVPFLVMECLPGRSLADEMAEGAMTLERLCEVLADVLAALEAAHAAGMVHRDVKPGNILLADDGHVKVGDFGIAKVLDSEEQTVTTDLIATPVYLAPERLGGAPADPRGDLYAVGVLAYEALAGRRPFSGPTPSALLQAIERGRPEPLGRMRPDAPAAIVATIERAMDRDPRRRFSSATEMRDALRAASGRAEAARSTPTVPVAVAPLPDGGVERTQTLAQPGRAARPDQRRRVLRRTWRPLLGARMVVVLGALAVVAVMVLAVVGDDPAPRSGPPSTPSTAADSERATTAPSATVLPAPLERTLRDLEREVRR